MKPSGMQNTENSRELPPTKAWKGFFKLCTEFVFHKTTEASIRIDAKQGKRNLHFLFWQANNNRHSSVAFG